MLGAHSHKRRMDLVASRNYYHRVEMSSWTLCHFFSRSTLQAMVCRVPDEWADNYWAASYSQRQSVWLAPNKPYSRCTSNRLLTFIVFGIFCCRCCPSLLNKLLLLLLCQQAHNIDNIVVMVFCGDRRNTREFHLQRKQLPQVWRRLFVENVDDDDDDGAEIDLYALLTQTKRKTKIKVSEIDRTCMDAWYSIHRSRSHTSHRIHNSCYCLWSE